MILRKLILITSTAFCLSACSSTPSTSPKELGNQSARAKSLDQLSTYKECMLYGATQLYKQKETAETLASAAHGRCIKPFNLFNLYNEAYRTSLATTSNQKRLASLQAQESNDKAKETVKSLFLSKILVLRQN